MTHRLRVLTPMMMFVFAGALSSVAHAGDNFKVDIQIISAQPGTAHMDGQLKKYQKDFRAMPYKSFKLVDSHTKQLRQGESVNMQFPGTTSGKNRSGKRFLKIKANGGKDGKLSFSLSIDAIRFRTSVLIPNNGTIIVAGPKHGKGVILLAVTAHSR